MEYCTILHFSHCALAMGHLVGAFASHAGQVMALPKFRKQVWMAWFSEMILKTNVPHHSWCDKLKKRHCSLVIWGQRLLAALFCNGDVSMWEIILEGSKQNYKQPNDNYTFSMKWNLLFLVWFLLKIKYYNIAMSSTLKILMLIRKKLVIPRMY